MTAFFVVMMFVGFALTFGGVLNAVWPRAEQAEADVAVTQLKAAA